MKETRYNKVWSRAKMVLPLYLFAFLPFVVSCSLDYEPISSPSELTQGASTDTATAVLKDKAAAESQLTVLYNLLKDRQEHWSLDIRLLGDVHADNAYAGTTGAEVVNFENNAIDGSNQDLERDWTRYLEDIAQANVLVNGVEQLRESGALTDTEYRQLRAQGQLFRAMIMFNMGRIWGSFPVITSIAKTITSQNIEEVYPVYFPPRSTPEECFAQIISDLEYAAENAPDFNNADHTRLTKTAALGYLAKAYAEKPQQDYKKVIEAVDRMVASAPGLALEPDFETLWGYDADQEDCIKRNTTEGILEVQYSKGAGAWESMMYGRILNDWNASFDWAKWITPSRDIINDFTQEGDEVRLGQSVVYYECTWSNYYPASHYAFMYKYRSNLNNRYMLRLADLLLLEAEAYAYEGNAQKAADLVNQVRQRAKLQPVTAQGDMVEKVLHERRLELAFEGERWFDLCRNNKVEQYMNAVFAKDAGRLPQKRLFDENSYLFPIPQTALDQNVNLEQNPGY